MTSTIVILAIFLAHVTYAFSAHINPKRERTVRTLDRGLVSSPLHGQGRSLEASGWKHHVSPYLMAAAFATESSLGRAPCRNDRFNIAGLASCTDSWRVPRFHSWPHFFDYYARFLHQRWPNARTAWDFHGYALCSECWGSRVAWFMRKLFRVGPSVTYP